MEDKEIERHLETIMESAKMLTRSDEPAIETSAKRLLVIAQYALTYKFPARPMERLVEFE